MMKLRSTNFGPTNTNWGSDSTDSILACENFLENIPSGCFTLRLLQETNDEICSINKELEKILNQRDSQNLGASALSITGKSFTLLNSSSRSSNRVGKFVGLENDFVTVLDFLTRAMPLQLKVFAVTGMGGIGKTTFTQKLYDDPLVIHHFYDRAWVTISQQYQAREMLLRLLSCLTNLSDEIYESSDEHLRERVYKRLKGRRYLIVLDDVWDDRAWDDLKRIFPDDQNGSRIMLTSRLTKVAFHASPDTPPHCLRFLNMEESFELLCSMIFLNQSCPEELVEIGKQISVKCQGLPLAIVLVGGLLSKMNMTLEIWVKVALSVGSLVMEDADQHCRNILSLSYNHLPDPLKICFLYMAIFPEDYEISAQKLTWLWIAEGFILPRNKKTLEQVAEEYLEDLTDRGMVMVKRRGSNGRIKICYIHDFMRDLCLERSKQNNFLSVINDHGKLPIETDGQGSERNRRCGINRFGKRPIEADGQGRERNLRHLPLESERNLRRVSFHNGVRKYMNRRFPLPGTRSFFSFETLRLKNKDNEFDIKFKVLGVLVIHDLVQTSWILNFYNLRYIALTTDLCSLDSIFSSKLGKLQTIVIDCEWDGHLPSDFWRMQELRHFRWKRKGLPHHNTVGSHNTVYDPLSYRKRKFTVFPPQRIVMMQNLQSLSAIRPINCTKQVFLSWPNLKKLGVYETEEDFRFHGWLSNLVYLQELEALKYFFSNPFVSPNLRPARLPSYGIFPPNLLKLSLSGTSFPWEDMINISMLPKLQVLKLRNYAFSGSIWKTQQGGFCCLKFLLIGSTNLEVWECDGTDHFPRLEHLVLRHCRSLIEVPYGIAEAPLLDKIELHCCSDSAVTSARQIQEEQQSLGNDLLNVYITVR